MMFGEKDNNSGKQEPYNQNQNILFIGRFELCAFVSGLGE